jgi:hypothetical protein
MKNIKTGEERKGTLNDDETKAFDERGKEFDYKEWLPTEPSPGFLATIAVAFIVGALMMAFFIKGAVG